MLAVVVGSSTGRGGEEEEGGDQGGRSSTRGGFGIVANNNGGDTSAGNCNADHHNKRGGGPSSSSRSPRGAAVGGVNMLLRLLVLVALLVTIALTVPLAIMTTTARTTIIITDAMMMMTNLQQQSLSTSSGTNNNTTSIMTTTAAATAAAAATTTTTTITTRISEPTPQDAMMNVTFLKDLANDEFHTYSGMWMTSTQNLLRVNNSELGNRESASFRLFRHIGHHNIRMTADWLSFNVEHLSMYTKWLNVDDSRERNNNIAYKSIKNRLDHYVQQTVLNHIPMQWRSGGKKKKLLAPSFTLAVLPFTAGLDENTNSARLARLQLEATLVSLWKFGIARAVVVGQTENDAHQANSVFDSITELYQTSVTRNRNIARGDNDNDEHHYFLPIMEMSYVRVTRATASEMGKNLCQGSLMDAQLALTPPGGGRDASAVAAGSSTMMSDAVRRQWLGTTHQRPLRYWKYVYYSEPDLILNVRSAALPALSAELSKGMILASHRLQPLPLSSDFVGYDNARGKVIPAMGYFAKVQALDQERRSSSSGATVTTVDACCDAGMDWPGKRNKCVGTFWWKCGYEQEPRNASSPTWDIKTVERLHRLKLAYPMFRIRSGFGVPVVAEHARRCHVVQRTTNTNSDNNDNNNDPCG